MQLLYVAMFIVFIVGTLGVSSSLVGNVNQTQQSLSSALVQTAQEGASLYIACSATTVPAGQYAATSFNIGIGASTPLGNQWGCVKAAGGVFGSLITTVSFISPPASAPGMGSKGVTDSLVQQNLAYQISEDVINLVQFQPNTIVGTIPSGSIDMSLLAPAGQTLPVLSAGLGFATPAIVGGLYATTPTNNQTSATP